MALRAVRHLDREEGRFVSSGSAAVETAIDVVDIVKAGNDGHGHGQVVDGEEDVPQGLPFDLVMENVGRQKGDDGDDLHEGVQFAGHGGGEAIEAN